MANAATAVSLSPQAQIADNLRRQRHEARVAQTQPIRDIPVINQGANREEESVPGTVTNTEAEYARREQAYKIKAAARSVLPEQNQRMWLEEQVEQLREDSEDMDVSQLGPIRAAKQKFADQAAKRAAEAIKEKAREKINRTAVLALDEVGGGIVEVTEGSLLEVDLGIGTVGDLAYDYARLGVTVLVPTPTDVGETAGEAIQYTASKAIHTVIPPYKFILGGAGIVDIIDDAMAVFKLGILSTILLTLALFAGIIICMLAYAQYTLGSIGWGAIFSLYNSL